MRARSRRGRCATGTEIEDIYGMAQPVAIEDPMLEYRAVREGVGLLDFSPLMKVDIEGPDAKRKLNRLHTRDLSKVTRGADRLRDDPQRGRAGSSTTRP